jgi:hypothetical protein
MLPHVTEARYKCKYTIWLRFSDGAEGEVDLSKELHGPIFEALKDVSFFRRFAIHPELKTLVWPNGPDLAPGFLRAAIKVAV